MSRGEPGCLLKTRASSVRNAIRWMATPAKRVRIFLQSAISLAGEILWTRYCCLRRRFLQATARRLSRPEQGRQFKVSSNKVRSRRSAHGADGRLVSIDMVDIKGQSGSAVSLMPEGLQAGLSLQEFTDLIEYLATLQQSRIHAAQQSWDAQPHSATR